MEDPNLALGLPSVVALVAVLGEEGTFLGKNGVDE